MIAHSLRTILPIDIKSPARSDDARVMLDWASVRWAFVFCISSSLLLVAFSMRRTLSTPAPQGGVRYREPLKRVQPSCVRTPSVWDWSSGRMDCDILDVNSAPPQLKYTIFCRPRGLAQQSLMQGKYCCSWLVYRKLYTLIGGQRAEKFENHCFMQMNAVWQSLLKISARR